jgi:hypothetical protein
MSASFAPSSEPSLQTKLPHRSPIEIPVGMADPAASPGGGAVGELETVVDGGEDGLQLSLADGQRGETPLPGSSAVAGLS